LEAYDPKLLERPFLVVLNKIDSEDAQMHIDDFRERFDLGDRLFETSALEKEGVKAVSLALHGLCKAAEGEQD